MPIELKGIVERVSVGHSDQNSTVTLTFHCKTAYGAIELYEHLLEQVKRTHLKIELIGRGQ